MTRILCPGCGEDDLLAAWYAEGPWLGRVELERADDGFRHEPLKHRDLEREVEAPTTEQLTKPDFCLCACCDDEFHPPYTSLRKTAR